MALGHQAVLGCTKHSKKIYIKPQILSPLMIKIPLENFLMLLKTQIPWANIMLLHHFMYINLHLYILYTYICNSEEDFLFFFHRFTLHLRYIITREVGKEDIHINWCLINPMCSTKHFYI